MTITACGGGENSSVNSNEQINSASSQNDDDSNGITSAPEIEAEPETSNQTTFDSFTLQTTGAFFDLLLDVGGIWDMDLNADRGLVVGRFNATELEGADTVLCGAGDLSSEITHGMLNGVFSGNDSGLGCNFDSGWYYDLEAEVSQDLSAIHGRYRISDEFGALHAPGQEGIFESWSAGNQPRAQMRGQDCRAFLIAPIHQLKKQIGSIFVDR